MPVVEIRRNRMVNPKPTVFAGSQWTQPSTGSITADGVTSTLSSTTTPYMFTAPAAGGATLGRVYAFRAKVRATMAAGSATTAIQIRVHKRVGNAYYNPTAGALSMPADGVQREVAFYWQATVDIANADGFELSGVGNGTALAGSTLSFDDVLIEDVGSVIPVDAPAAFFYGGSPSAASLDGAAWDYYSWAGAVGNSESIATRQIRLTAFPDMAPVPRVLLDVPVSLFPVGSVTVSLTRTSEGRTLDVRRGQRLPVASPAIVTDHEPGFGVISSYTIVGRNSAGDIVGTFPVGTIKVDYDKVVVQQPLDPRLAVQVSKLDGTGDDLARETPGQTSYPQGESLPGMVGLGPRRGLDGVALELMVDTRADADALQATLGTYETRQLPVWLIRTPPGFRMPAVFFCHVPRLVEKNTLLKMGLDQVLFSASVTEVKPPAAGISAAVLTYSDIAVFYATYSSLAAAYATYSDISRDTSLVGAADA